MPFGWHKLFKNHCGLVNFEGDMSNFVVSTLPADGLAPAGAGAFAGTVMTEFLSFIYTNQHLKGKWYTGVLVILLCATRDGWCAYLKILLVWELILTPMFHAQVMLWTEVDMPRANCFPCQTLFSKILTNKATCYECIRRNIFSRDLVKTHEIGICILFVIILQKYILLNDASFYWYVWDSVSGLILGLGPANERHRYFVTTSLIGWAQT